MFAENMMNWLGLMICAFISDKTHGEGTVFNVARHSLIK